MYFNISFRILLILFSSVFCTNSAKFSLKLLETQSGLVASFEKESETQRKGKHYFQISRKASKTLLKTLGMLTCFDVVSAKLIKNHLCASYVYCIELLGIKCIKSPGISLLINLLLMGKFCLFNLEKGCILKVDNHLDYIGCNSQNWSWQSWLSLQTLSWHIFVLSIYLLISSQIYKSRILPFALLLLTF